jgi:UDP-GlcNAc:undecaprenyl-phosphate GlcNAc-1-phosphate transferase
MTHQQGQSNQTAATQPAGETLSPEVGGALGQPLQRAPEDGFSPLTPPAGDFETLGAFPPETALPSESELSLDTILSPYVIVFCVAFIVAYFFTPVMRTIAVSYGIVDLPDRERKIHSRPVAYLGGVAVFMGFIAGLAACHAFAEVYHPAWNTLVKIPLAIIGASCLIVLLGLFDDLKGTRPRLKIVVQVLAAMILLLSGIGMHLADQVVNYAAAWMNQHILHLVGLEVPAMLVWAIAMVSSTVLVVALVVFCCNASNLMDGLDGLCGGITVVIAVGLIALAAHLAMTGPAERAMADSVRLVLAIALLGAVLGFLPFNFNPASIFMGDTGSLLMGFVVAVILILLGEVGSKWLMGGLVMFSLPMLDTFLALARRFVNKRPFFAADKQHFHHQLVGRGLSVRRAVVLSYGLTLFFVLSGTLLVFLRTRYAVAFYLVLFGCIIVAAYKMGMIHERRVADRGRQARREPEPEEEGLEERLRAALEPGSEDLEDERVPAEAK